MLAFYRAVSLLSLALAALTLAGCFFALLLGWPVHAVIAALLFNAFFVLWRELSGLAVARADAVLRRPFA